VLLASGATLSDENIEYYMAKLEDLVKKFGSLSAAASTPKQENLAL